MAFSTWTGRAMSPQAALALLERELRRAPGTLAPLPAARRWLMEDDAFTLHVEPDSTIGYRRGQGVTVDRGDATPEQEIDLFCEGSLAAAVVAMNGLYPFHASAVAGPHGAVLLTGPSGAGKSTLAAALALQGWPLLADDLVVLAGEARELRVVPWRKRLKLWPDSVTALGLEAGEIVSPLYAKHFIDVPRSDAPAPPVALVLLAEGGGAAPRRLTSSETLAAWAQEHYTSALLAEARGWDAADRFRDAARMAGAMPAFTIGRAGAPAATAASLMAFLQGELA